MGISLDGASAGNGLSGFGAVAAAAQSQIADDQASNVAALFGSLGLGTTTDALA